MSRFVEWIDIRTFCVKVIEGFGGKRALGFLLKSDLCHAVLFKCVKQCSACFFPEVCIVFEILRMQKTLYLLSCQHVTAKTVISLQIQQIIDLLQRATLKNVDFRLKPLKF